MLFRITHKTRFDYSEDVSETVFEVRMAPCSGDDQTALSFDLKLSPRAPLVSYRDGFGNRVDLFNLMEPYRTLSLEAVSLVRTHRRPARERLEGLLWNADWSSMIEGLEYLGPSPLVDSSPALGRLLQQLPRPEGTMLDFLHALVAALRERFAYDKRATTERTPLSEALALGRGVCQDYAHLCIGSCRALGVPARYASGYVNHPGEIATHAWCQVWCGPEVDWVDLDPTTGQFAADDHVVVAVGRDYSDVPPNRGVRKGTAEERMEVTVVVEPLERLPNTWEGWETTAAWPQSTVPGSTRPRSAHGRAGELGTWPAYPNQPLPKALLFRQQGQQQQQTRAGDSLLLFHNMQSLR